MYRFYCDDTLFYKSGVDDKEYYLLDSKLSLEKGKIGSLSFTLPSSNVVYDRIHKLKSIITVYDDEEEIFRGRVLYDEKDFYNRKSITCEGELAFLLDSIVRPYEHQGKISEFFSFLIENHNSQVEERKQFNVGNVTVTDNNDYINRSSTDYDNTYEVITKKLIESHGGYLKIRVVDGVRYIDFVEDYGEVNDQVIEFGVNLLDIKEFITAENIFTCLIPLGAKGEDGNRLTINNVNSGVDYLQNDTGVDLFGKIWAFQTWDDVTVASNLKTKAQEYLDANIEMSVTLTLKAVDLHLINVNTDRIKAGDKLRVISIPHKIDKYFECTKVEINPINPQNNAYTFGSTYKSLTDPSTSVDSITSKYVEEAITKVEETTQQHIANIKENLTQEEIMNIITNNGESQGVYLVNGQIWINGQYIDVDELSAITGNLGTINAGTIRGLKGEIGGFTLDTYLSSNGIVYYNFNQSDLDRVREIIRGDTPTSSELKKYDMNSDGKITELDHLKIQRIINGTNSLDTEFVINPTFDHMNNNDGVFKIRVGDNYVLVTNTGQLYSSESTLGRIWVNGTGEFGGVVKTKHYYREPVTISNWNAMGLCRGDGSHIHVYMTGVYVRDEWEEFPITETVTIATSPTSSYTLENPIVTQYSWGIKISSTTSGYGSIGSCVFTSNFTIG